jgi:hypothetical protein
MKSKVKLILCGQWMLLALIAHIFIGATNITSPDPAERRDAVDNVSDQALLAKLAVDDKDPGVRKGAVKKLTDQILWLSAKVADWSCRDTIGGVMVEAMNRAG